MEIATARPVDSAVGRWVPAAVFVVAVAIFVAVFRTYFSSTWLPLSDSASNDMLVLDAKRLALLHGNYSRVGFYHPGPHLLYLMAAGEYLFHDLLGIAKATEAAQQLAVICLSIVILQIVERVYRDLAGDVLMSLCATAATALCVLLMLPQAFTSMWVPYTYVTSGLLFFVGAAALIAGHFKWLWVFVLGSAMLVSGHASFFGLVPMMDVVLVGAIVALQPQARSLSGIRVLMADHRGSVIASAVILAILLLPIVLQLLLHFPGDFAKYLEFSGKQPRKEWTAVASVVLPYWKFMGVAVVIFGAGLVACRSRALLVSRQKTIAAAALAVFIAGTGAVIFYLQRGVDIIADQNLYLVWWYQAAPATCVGLAVVSAGMATTRRLPFLAILVLLLAAGLWSMRGPVPTGGSDSANVEKTMALLRQKSREIGRPVRIALDVKPSFFVDTWARTVALIDAQERRNGKIACIEDYDWQLSYHERNRCAPANPNEVQIRYVASYDDLTPIGGVLLSTFLGLRLFDIKPSDWPRDRIRGPWVGLSEHAADGTLGNPVELGKAVR